MDPDRGNCACNWGGDRLNLCCLSLKFPGEKTRTIFKSKDKLKQKNEATLFGRLRDREEDPAIQTFLLLHNLKSNVEQTSGMNKTFGELFKVWPLFHPPLFPCKYRLKGEPVFWLPAAFRSHLRFPSCYLGKWGSVFESGI